MTNVFERSLMVFPNGLAQEGSEGPAENDAKSALYGP